jgi:hypothetical protein
LVQREGYLEEAVFENLNPFLLVLNHRQVSIDGGDAAEDLFPKVAVEVKMLSTTGPGLS